MKKLITGYLLFLIPASFLVAQSNPKTTSESKLAFAFSGGVNLSGAVQQYEDAMVEADLGDDAIIGHSHYTYPYSEKTIGAYEVWIQYQFSNKGSVLLGGSLLERFTTRGENEESDHARLWLETKVHQLRCQYVFHGKSRWSVSIGPGLTFIKVEDTYPSTYEMTSSSTSFGLVGGINFHFIEAKNFFFFLATNGNYVLPAEIGPFYAHRTFVPPDPQYPLKFNPDDISFSSVNFQLGFGWKF